MKFKIEFVKIERKNSYVIVRQMSKGDFEIRDCSFLGPVELKAFTNQPWAIKPDGTPDFEVFAFYPKDKSKLMSWLRAHPKIKSHFMAWN